MRKAPDPTVAVWAAGHRLESLFFSPVGKAELRYGFTSRTRELDEWTESSRLPMTNAPATNTRTLIRECLLIVVLVGGWIVLLPVLAFLFYSPHEGGPIHLMGLLLRDLFVDRRPGVWGLILTPYTVVQLLRLVGAAVGILRSRG